jgi:3,4-dihydroxy 2-butanone 4-phosphate synthase/GTP cyclohydrolase II
MSISTIKEAIVDIKSGRMVILVDDEDRENEGDLCMAAEFVTPEAVNFMARYGRGLICLSLNEELADKLRLYPMVRDNRSRFGTAFTVSIEAKRGVSTGISAADRATTIHAAVADDAPTTWSARDMSFPFAPAKGGCSSGAARRKALSIWPGWPA